VLQDARLYLETRLDLQTSKYGLITLNWKGLARIILERRFLSYVKREHYLRHGLQFMTRGHYGGSKPIIPMPPAYFSRCLVLVSRRNALTS
jgi:hypothetical protein